MSRLTDWLFGEAPAANVREEGDGAEAPIHDPSSVHKIPSRAGGYVVSFDEAVSMSIIYRAIQIHVTAIKQLSLNTYRGDAKIDNPAFIKRPNINMSRSALFEQIVVSLIADGNAFAHIKRNDRNEVNNIIMLNPFDVGIETDKDGNVKKYTYNNRNYKPEDIKHMAIMRVPGKNRGLSPLKAANSELRGGLDLREYAANWFNDKGTPSGVLKSTQFLSEEQAKIYREQFEQSNAARGGIAVLGNDLSYQPVYLNPEQSQFLENQKFLVTQISRMLFVPSSLMLASIEGNSQTYSNVEQDWIGYVRFGLMNLLVEIEDAFSDLLPGTQQVKFNVEALLRSDTITRYGAHKIAIEAGFLTIEEVRAIENLGKA